MKRSVLALFVPPFAVCRYGCAGCCAAPIGVFWITGIVSIIYAFYGGPAQAEGISMGTLALGVVLWGIAAAWARNTIHGATKDGHQGQCDSRQTSSVCTLVHTNTDQSDPMEEVKKFHS